MQSSTELHSPEQVRQALITRLIKNPKVGGVIFTTDQIIATVNEVILAYEHHYCGYPVTPAQQMLMGIFLKRLEKV